MRNLLILATTLLHASMMQMPSTPPIRMGLWEATFSGSVTMDGKPAPTTPGVTTGKSRSCYTPQSWTGAFGSDSQRGCKRVNETWANRKYSFDLECPNMHGTGHIEATFAGEESGHGSVHIEMEPPGHHMVMDRTFDLKFVSADCGAVTPEHPVMVK